MEYLMRGEVASLLHNLNNFEEPMAKHYVAEIGDYPLLPPFLSPFPLPSSPPSSPPP
jgi:hypothetical protein